MKLNREKWQFAMQDALVAAIIGIDKPGHKSIRQRSNRETVILCGDIAAFALLEETGLILTSMPMLRKRLSQRLEVCSAI